MYFYKKCMFHAHNLIVNKNERIIIMFSSMIQNLLASSGQASAMQRAAQMNSYIYKYNPNYTKNPKSIIS